MDPATRYMFQRNTLEYKKDLIFALIFCSVVFKILTCVLTDSNYLHPYPVERSPSSRTDSQYVTEYVTTGNVLLITRTVSFYVSCYIALE